VIRPDWKDLAWLIGFILGWLLSWLPAPARAGGFDDVAVRVVNQRGPIADIGSGTLVAGDGRTALVITCKHIFAEGRGVLTVERTNHTRYPARLLGTSRFNDISALEIPDPGVRPLRIASQQPRAATLIGWGSTQRAWKHRGTLTEIAGRTAFYSFTPEEGDSGGGAFDDTGALAGVVWGTDGSSGATVPLSDLRAALAGPACSRYFRQTSTKVGNPMFPLILAAGMIGQMPPMPDKSPPAQQLPAPPSKTLPSPQTRATPQATPMPAFVPAQQYEAAPQYELAQAPALDIPITFRVRIRPQIDIAAEAYAPAPRAQAYAPQPQVSYGGGGGCYGGSYSAGSYGYSGGFAAQAYAAPAAAVLCPSGVCYGGVGFGLASRPFGRKIKIKEGPGIGLGPRGLRELLGR
jgi:hypothetical protein